MSTQLNIALESPGVLINEVNLSQITSNAVGTNVFVTGFTPQGVTDEPTIVSSITEWEEIFGLPTTTAEKYAHNAVKQLLTTSNASVTFTRMPYGSGGGQGFSDTYNALVFPVIGVSAVEVHPCDYFRQVDEENCRVNFPWVYDEFIPTSICVGSKNLNCPLNSQDEQAGFVYVQDFPVQYNSIWTGFKFVVDNDTDPEDLRIFQLRPTVSGTNTVYNVVTSINLSGSFATAKDEDQVNLSNDAKRLLVNLSDSIYASPYYVTSGLLSGQTLSGIQVSAGDVFATYSIAGAPVLKYYNADASVAGSFNTGITNIAGLSAGGSFSVVTSAKNATTQDFLIEFCTVPVDVGLSCQTITAMKLEVPEKDRYTFYPLLGDAALRDANFYVLGEPISKSLNASEYQLLMNDQFNWKCGVMSNVEASLDLVGNDVRAGLIVINEMKTAQLEDFSGFYLAVNDNLNVNPSTTFDDITAVAGYYQDVCPGVSGEWIDVPSERLNFQVSQSFNSNAGSISEIVEQNAGLDFGTQNYNDSLIVSLFKIRPTRLTETINKLDQILVEKYIGSLDAKRKIQSPDGGAPRSYFIENTVNNQSNYLRVITNPYLSDNNCWADQATGIPKKTIRMFREKTASVFANFDAQATLKAYSDKLYGVGSYDGYCRDEVFELCQKKDIGNLPAKLERALRNVENPLEFPIDITIDAGLSTIWSTRAAVKNDPCITDTSICYHYDDRYYVDTNTLAPFDGTTMASPIQDAWEVIYNTFDSFARLTRKTAGGVGHLHIQDPIRQIFVNGANYKVVNRQKEYLIDPTTNQPTERYSTFARNIFAYLRNLYAAANSNYSCTYANWLKDHDVNTDTDCWFGPSAHVAALMARLDRSQYPWTPPFGISKGTLPNVLDIAINPNQRERDLLARINCNPICLFPGDGYVLYNANTLQKEQSALQEINIRRGLIWLGNSVQGNLRQFIGLPNTVQVRTRVKNQLRPILEFMKNYDGLYDYAIICDDRNNTPETIDQNQLRIAIYVKPVKAIKYIIVDFIITSTSTSFEVIM